MSEIRRKQCTLADTNKSYEPGNVEREENNTSKY